MIENQIPLARLFSVKEMSGWLGKSLEVPANRLGIVIYPGQPAKTFTPGKHQVLSIFQRIRGISAGTLVGYIPAQAFPVHYRANDLLSGDDELVDASFVAQAEIKDPGRFFVDTVVPRRAITNESFELSDPVVYEAFRYLVSGYEVEDLECGVPTERLLSRVAAPLTVAFENAAIQACSYQLLSFARSAERIQTADKMQTLQQKLDETSLGAEAARISSQGEMDEMMRQAALAAGLRGGVRPVVGAGNAKDAGLRDGIQQLSAVGKRSQTNKHHGILDSIFKKKEAEKPLVRRKDKYWWLGRVLWMVFLVALGWMVTDVIQQRVRADAGTRWEFILPLWGIIAGFLLESLKKLYEKREELAEMNWPGKGTTFLDDLTGSNRQRADGLVRAQCSQDIRHIQGILNDVRGRVYHDGDNDLALRIRDLERKLEEKADLITRLDFGSAPYLGDFKISRKLWDEMLDYDEKLLVRVASASDRANEIQQKYAPGVSISGDLDTLERKVDAFIHHFSIRSRPMAVTAETIAKSGN